MPAVDVKFIFECSTSERSERMRYRAEHEKIHIHKWACHITCLCVDMNFTDLRVFNSILISNPDLPRPGEREIW